MEQAYKEIAPRLVGLRDALGESVEEFAARVGVDPATVQLYEGGQTEIPVGFLMEVSKATGVELNTLIAGSESHLVSHSVVRSGKGLSVDRRKDYDYKNLAYRFKGRKMEPFEIRVPAKAENEISFTRHSGQEFIYMLEGRLEIRIGDKVEILVPGDSIYFDSQTPHGMRGLDGKQARFLDVIL
ncbi:MAG: XRE family transcriptional regulator [Desulfovibrionaceae bacterium]